MILQVGFSFVARAYDANETKHKAGFAIMTNMVLKSRPARQKQKHYQALATIVVVGFSSPVISDFFTSPGLGSLLKFFWSVMTVGSTPTRLPLSLWTHARFGSTQNPKRFRV